jgi:hypothetical protein
MCVCACVYVCGWLRAGKTARVTPRASSEAQHESEDRAAGVSQGGRRGGQAAGGRAFVLPFARVHVRSRRVKAWGGSGSVSLVACHDPRDDLLTRGLLDAAPQQRAGRGVEAWRQGGKEARAVFPLSLAVAGCLWLSPSHRVLFPFAGYGRAKQ